MELMVEMNSNKRDKNVTSSTVHMTIKLLGELMIDPIFQLFS